MGDSETVVSDSSAVMGYATYSSTGYADASSNVPNTGAFPYEATGYEAVAGANSTAHSGSGLGDGNVYSTEHNPVMPEAHVNATFETNPAVSTEKDADSENAATNQVADANSSVNANMDEVGNLAVENGNASDNVGRAIDEQQFDGFVPAMTAEEDRLWNIVRTNSLDFNAWTSLIEETEKVAQENILKIRKVYDAFLAEFPLCYGYWKKYADHEAHLGSVDKVVEVYERAVQGVTYSVDIWLHYCIFAIGTYGDPDTVRRLFERGLAYVGTDYLSFTLWDKYIEYEYMQQEWGRLAMIYTRILEYPNQQLDRYFNSIKELAGSRPLSELRTAEEAAAAAGAVSEANNHTNEGEVHPDAGEQSPNPVSAGLTEAEELQQYIAIREEMYKKAKEFDSKIIGFETAIRRPYFHVRPLNVAELENWQSYLDFMEREGDFNKQLFNREIELRLKHGPSIWFL